LAQRGSPEESCVRCSNSLPSSSLSWSSSAPSAQRPLAALASCQWPLRRRWTATSSFSQPPFIQWTKRRQTTGLVDLISLDSYLAKLYCLPSAVCIRANCSPQSFNTAHKVDWHNYAQIAAEAARVGPGEQGKAVAISPSEKHLVDQLYSANGFNAHASDKIALDRSVADIRHSG
jgi:hypothetical protein